MNETWQNNEREWFDMCDAYGEEIYPGKEEIAEMHFVASPWYRTDGGIAYCKKTNTFCRRGIDNPPKYYRVTEESIARKKRILHNRKKKYYQDMLEDLECQKRHIEQILQRFVQ